MRTDHPFMDDAGLLRDLARDLRRYLKDPSGDPPIIESVEQLRGLPAVRFVAAELDHTYIQMSDTRSEAWYVYRYLGRAADRYENMARLDIITGNFP